MENVHVDLVSVRIWTFPYNPNYEVQQQQQV